MCHKQRALCRNVSLVGRGKQHQGTSAMPPGQQGIVPQSGILECRCQKRTATPVKGSAAWVGLALTLRRRCMLVDQAGWKPDDQLRSMKAQQCSNADTDRQTRAPAASAQRGTAQRGAATRRLGSPKGALLYMNAVISLLLSVTRTACCLTWGSPWLGAKCSAAFPGDDGRVFISNRGFPSPLAGLSLLQGVHAAMDAGCSSLAPALSLNLAPSYNYV